MNSRQRRRRKHQQRMFLRQMPRLFKKTYGPVLEELFKDIKLPMSYLPRGPVDNTWNEPVILGVEHGVVFKED